MTRPSFLVMTACLLLPAASGRVSARVANEAPSQAEALIEQAGKALAAGRTTSDLLADAAFLPVHEETRFRELIRRSTTSSRVTIVTPAEPGEELVVTGRLLDRDRRPLTGARVYAYQTSAKGWYSELAPHVSGMEGDRRHARLFGYLATDRDGGFEIRTIRPVGYPGSDLPAHIHIEVEPAADGAAGLVTEILFDDDPRLTPAALDRARTARFIITHPAKDAGGVQRVVAELVMP